MLNDTKIVSVLQAQSKEHSPITLDMFLGLFRYWERENGASNKFDLIDAYL